MTLSDRVRTEVERELGRRIVDAGSVAGGCISPSYRLRCADGSTVFLKTAPADAPDDMLPQEARSLKAIEATGALRVPSVRAATGSWLALEWLEPSHGRDEHWDEHWDDLGRSLARLHRSTQPRYGWGAANFIGSLPQTNEWTADWPAFWREQRLGPQLRRARRQLNADTASAFARLMDELEERLAGAADDGASLLHGDLWSGNVHLTDGGAAVIDPSSYYGHREVDLAMAALFGGFPAAFFDAYSAEWPLAPGAGRRRGIYQLYYLLVHVNLFGGGYVAQTARTLRDVLSRPVA